MTEKEKRTILDMWAAGKQYKDISAELGNEVSALKVFVHGSHMFQDMVEAEMTYSAIWNDPRTLRYKPDLLADGRDLFPEICPELSELQDLIVVKEPRDLHFWLDSVKNHALCGIGGQAVNNLFP